MIANSKVFVNFFSFPPFLKILIFFKKKFVSYYIVIEIISSLILFQRLNFYILFFF
jgi:hypothetical protein